MRFDNFYGNDETKEYLSSAFSRKAFPHALLLTGARGIGKRTLADIIARALVCECGTFSVPCGDCPSCKKASNGFHPDIIKIDIDSSSYGVNYIRKLKLDALILPNDAERKVYIFNNAEAMTHEAQDAFLKILEEPPSFTFFILLCSSPSDLLPTIVSRTAHIRLSRLCDGDIEKIIRKNLPDATDTEVKEIIRTSDGVCSFLAKEASDEFLSCALPIAEALVTRDELKIFSATNAIEKNDRATLSKILDELTVIFRDALIISSSAESRLLSGASSNLSDALAKTFDASDFLALTDEIADAKNACTRNVGVSHITGKLISKFTYIATK